MTLGLYYFAITLAFFTPGGSGSPDSTKTIVEHFRSKNACIVSQTAFGRMANSDQYKVKFPTDEVITYWTKCHQVVIQGYEI